MQARLAGGDGPSAASARELSVQLCASLVARGEVTIARQGHHFFAGSAMVEAASMALPAEAAAKARAPCFASDSAPRVALHQSLHRV